MWNKDNSVFIDKLCWFVVSSHNLLLLHVHSKLTGGHEIPPRKTLTTRCDSSQDLYLSADLFCCYSFSCGTFFCSNVVCLSGWFWNKPGLIPDSHLFNFLVINFNNYFGIRSEKKRKYQNLSCFKVTKFSQAC